MAELLLELFSEEIPARMQAPAADNLRRALLELIDTKLDLATDGVRTFVTPRRLVAVADGLATMQPDVVEERRGPRVGAPDKAIAGFLRAAGLESLDQCEQREDKKGTFHYAVLKRRGRPTAAVLAEEIPALIENFSWPKSMRWGRGSLRWVRPLHAILCLFDGAVVPGRLVIGDTALAFVGSTHGHRWMAPEAFAVRDFADYRAKLEDAKVVLDAGDRRRRIAAQAEALAAGAGLTLTPDEALLDEVCGLVEWPVCLLGTIDQAFMALPPEVLTTAMRSHQKYFALTDSEGRLANRFIVVANIEADDGGAAIRAGNERVLRARLYDAQFFWDQDRAQSLESRVGGLDDIVFHARLGSLGDKVRRLEVLAKSVAEHVGADPDLVARAARLCKADLFTGMVGELPTLQGVMGRYYALEDGEDKRVADAIAEHHAPQGPGDACPSAPTSVALALADRIDTLAGFFLIDQPPTGSKDPFALRRAALGVIRLVLDNRLRLPLLGLFRGAVAAYRHDGDEGAVAAAILAFFADRLRVHMRDQGLRHDVVSAVLAVSDDDDLVRLTARADALRGFLDTDDGANLLTAFRRAANIVRIEEKRDGAAYDGAVDESALVEDDERALNARLGEAETAIAAALAGEDFAAAMAALAGLRAPVDRFFDHVTVNAEDAGLRANRLRLLSRIGAALGKIADFTRIEG